MATVTLADLQDRTLYQKKLKIELDGLKDTPVKFRLYDKFEFTKQKKTGLLLLAGDLVNEKLAKAVDDTDAVVKSIGKCARLGDKLEFVPGMGSVPVDKLKPDLGNHEAAEVKKFSAPEGPAESGEAKTVKLLEAARTRYDTIMKHFDSIKSKLSDDGRKAVRAAFGDVDEMIEAKKLAELPKALNELDTTVHRALAKEAEEDAKFAEGKAVASREAAESAREAFNQAKTDLKYYVDEIAKETKSIKDNQVAARRPATKKAAETAIKYSQTRIQQLQPGLHKTQAALAKQKFPGLEEEAKKIAAAYVALQKQVDGAQDIAKEALAPPGKLKDNAELASARDAVKGKVGEMADAAKWQQDELKKAQTDSAKHGTARHGSQTGIDKQALRTATGLTPDQRGNEAGTGVQTTKWVTTLSWKKLPGGGHEVDDKAQIAKTVVREFSRKLPTPTASMFLNPVLEKQAVDTALAIANTQCRWTEWKDGATWKPIDSLTIIVPPPKTARGYGLAVEAKNQLVSVAETTAVQHVKDFETGKIKTIDELLTKLNAQLVPNPGDVGAQMMRHAIVVLERKNGAWSNKTQYPTASGPAWELRKGVALTGKSVRLSPTAAPEVAPLYAPG